MNSFPSLSLEKTVTAEKKRPDLREIAPEVHGTPTESRILKTASARCYAGGNFAFHSGNLLIPKAPASSTALRLLLALLPLAGCANPAPPHPPSLNLPNPVNDLRAERIGDDVLLHWTTPSQTTDKLPIKQPLTAKLCRTPGTCITFPAHPGPSQTVDKLLSPFNLDPPLKLSYQLTLRNAANRSASPSNLATIASGTAPNAVTQLGVVSAKTGAQLTWAPSLSPTAAVELHRELVQAALPPHVTDSVKAAPSASPAQAARGKPPVALRLIVPPSNTDAGGAMDPAAIAGQTYRYTATRVRTVSLGGETFSLRSAESVPVLLTFRDISAPARPAHLVVVIDFSPLNSQSGVTADLSWEPNTEPDLAGYNIYRTEAPGAASLAGGNASTPAEWRRVNTSLVTTPSYRDGTIPLNARFLYRVTAIDLSGNESDPTSPPVLVDSTSAASTP